MKFFLLIIYFFWSCSNRPEPDWIQNYPKDYNYWYGIGSIEKPFLGTDIREAARSQALNSISSQISVNIESSFTTVLTENNLKIDELTQSLITTQVKNSLSSIEIIDTYESKNRYYVMLRLAKKKYFDNIEQKRRNAVESSLELIKQAEQRFSARSFNLLNDAMNEIAPYINYPIEAEYPKGSGNVINLYSYIKKLVNEYMDRIKLVLPNELIEYKLGSEKEYELEVKVIDKNSGNPISNIPIFSYVNHLDKKPFALSDKEGKCYFSIPEVKYDRSIYHINYELDLIQLLNDKVFFSNVKEVQVQSVLKMIPPKVLLNITENILGAPLSNSYVEPEIVNFFVNNFSAEFISKGAPDLIINAIINTRSVSEDPNQYGIFQVFGDITISISSASTGALLLKKSFNKVQGSDFNSNEEAANQSLRKIKELVNSDFLPNIIDAMTIN